MLKSDVHSVSRRKWEGGATMLGQEGVIVKELNCYGDKGGPSPLQCRHYSLCPDGSHSNTECSMCEGSCRDPMSRADGLLVAESRQSSNRVSNSRVDFGDTWCRLGTERAGLCRQRIFPGDRMNLAE